MYVLIYDVHSICTIVGQRYKKLRCDLHLIPLHSALKHSQWLPKCKQLCTQKLFYQSKMIFLVHLGSPKPTQLIGSQLQCTLWKYDADLLLTLIMHCFDSNFVSGGSFEKKIAIYFLMKKYLVWSSCTVCSNGFYADISSQRQVQQYKSCLKSFL